MRIVAGPKMNWEDDLAAREREWADDALAVEAAEAVAQCDDLDPPRGIITSILIMATGYVLAGIVVLLMAEVL